MLVNPSALVRYLQRHAPTAPWTIEGCDRRDWSAVVVIPSLAEGESLLATLASLAANPPEWLDRTLALVVVNHRRDAPAAHQRANHDDLRRLRQVAHEPRPLSLAWIDAASAGRELPAGGGGVGLARKIGLDLALTRLDPNHPHPFLVSLDADTLVRPDYLPALYRHFAAGGAGGAVIPFRHQAGATPAAQRAIDRYELFVRHYVLGLTLAGSPYAFHTVGSALACRADAYVKAGGMNRRKAGEDFYFLQQLAKTSGVAQVVGTVVHPSARSSNRTPFGTGPSVARLLDGDPDAVRFYHPECFEILAQWLRLAADHPDLDGATLVDRAAARSEALADHLRSIGCAATWDRLRRNHPRPEALRKAFHGWFDGLATLRLIHSLSCGDRSRCAPEQSLPALLQWGGLEVSHQIEEQLRSLRIFQQSESRAPAWTSHCPEGVSRL